MGVQDRERIDQYARRRGLSVSDAVRELVVLGVGGELTDARELNREVAGRRRELLDGEPALPGGRRERSGRPGYRAEVLRVSLPRAWYRALPTASTKSERLAGALRAGLEVVGEE